MSVDLAIFKQIEASMEEESMRKDVSIFLNFNKNFFVII